MVTIKKGSIRTRSAKTKHKCCYSECRSRKESSNTYEALFDKQTEQDGIPDLTE